MLILYLFRFVSVSGSRPLPYCQPRGHVNILFVMQILFPVHSFWGTVGRPASPKKWAVDEKSFIAFLLVCLVNEGVLLAKWRRVIWLWRVMNKLVECPIPLFQCWKNKFYLFSKVKWFPSNLSFTRLALIPHWAILQIAFVISAKPLTGPVHGLLFHCSLSDWSLHIIRICHWPFFWLHSELWTASRPVATQRGCQSIVDRGKITMQITRTPPHPPIGMVSAALRSVHWK